MSCCYHFSRYVYPLPVFENALSILWLDSKSGISNTSISDYNTIDDSKKIYCVKNIKQLELALLGKAFKEIINNKSYRQTPRLFHVVVIVDWNASGERIQKSLDKILYVIKKSHLYFWISEQAVSSLGNRKECYRIFQTVTNSFVSLLFDPIQHTQIYNSSDQNVFIESNFNKNMPSTNGPALTSLEMETSAPTAPPTYTSTEAFIPSKRTEENSFSTRKEASLKNAEAVIEIQPVGGLNHQRSTSRQFLLLEDSITIGAITTRHLEQYGSVFWVDRPDAAFKALTKQPFVKINPSTKLPDPTPCRIERFDVGFIDFSNPVDCLAGPNMVKDFREYEKQKKEAGVDLERTTLLTFTTNYPNADFILSEEDSKLFDGIFPKPSTKKAIEDFLEGL